MQEGSATYNLACLYAQIGETDKALKSLEKVLKLVDDSREQIEADVDFDNIRKLPQYKQLLDKYRPLK